MPKIIAARTFGLTFVQAITGQSPRLEVSFVNLVIGFGQPRGT